MKTSALVRKTPMVRTAIKRSGPGPAPGPRKRACKACKTKFQPFRSFEAWCSPECGAIVAKERLAAQERKADKERKQKLKTRQEWLKEVEYAFNAFIRARDLAAGHGCISCGRYNTERWNAGHFKSVGAFPELRFNEDNVHLQCARPCNMDQGGNIHNYRIGLISRIGSERLAALESQWPLPKWSIDELKAMKAHYKNKLRELNKHS